MDELDNLAPPASHQVPVEEALEPAQEVQLRARGEVAVRLRGIGHVLVGLAEPAQLGDELLRLAGGDALVAPAVADPERGRPARPPGPPGARAGGPPRPGPGGPP